MNPRALSESLHSEAEKVLVGGVNSPVRSFRRVGGSPILAKNASGPYLWDQDGKKYIDLVMSYGPHLFGHSQKDIVDKISSTAKNGLCFGMTTQQEVEWAKKFLSFLPWAEKVRAMSSGTEACMTAVRLARGITGRELLVKFSGHFHGHVDALMVDAGSGVATLSEKPSPDSAGLIKSIVDTVKVLEFNDVESLKKLFLLEGKKIAAVILEPVMGNMGVVPPTLEFLETLRKLTKEAEALLIFDEVMTGFRVSKKSAHGFFGIEPDLCTFGKIVGGGLPLSALTGKAKYMDFLSPLGSVYQAGTLSGNPLGVSAGLKMLELISENDPYSRLDELGSFLEGAIEEIALKNQIELKVSRVGSMLSVFFRKQKPTNARETRDINENTFKKFFWALVEEGILIPPSPFEAYFLSTAHFEIEQKEWEDIFNRVFKRIR